MQFPDWARAALDGRRAAYADVMLDVDRALFLAAKSGDTKAADLVYRRFDNWNPRIVEQTNHIYNFADLVKGLKDGGAEPSRRADAVPEMSE